MIRVLFGLPQKMTVINGFGHGGFIARTKEQHFMGCTVRASERDSAQKFEFDRDKAKEALEQLDQKIQSTSKKRPASPKIKVSDVKFTSEPVLPEEPFEISQSFVATSAFVLLAFTVFYNILFYTVIKPSIDGPESEPAPASLEARVPMSDTAFLRYFPLSMPENVLQQ